MVAEWLSEGRLITDQLVSTGLSLLEKYKILDKMEHAKAIVIEQGKSILMKSYYFSYKS